MNGYGDIIRLERPISRRPKMQRQDRAKLFAPFAALSGHSAAVHARDKVLIPKIEKVAYGKEILDELLREVRRGDIVTVTWFVPLKRSGAEVLGEYQTVTERVIRLDLYDRVLYLEGRGIAIDDIEKLRKCG